MKSKSKTKTNQTQTQQATTTPTVPEWITGPLQGYTGQVTNFLNSDPSQYVAGASPLQDQAFAAAGDLTTPNPAFDTALNMAQGAAGAPASTAGLSTYNAPQLGDPAQVNLSGYNAPQLGDPSQVGQVNIAPTTYAGSASLMDNFNRYLDPATAELVDAALRNYDAQTGKQAAGLQAQQARTGAFGGSRAGIAQGEFAAASDRGRALTEGELRARAFGQAAQMADSDAGRRQQTGIFNAGSENQRGLSQAQLDMQRLAMNTGYQNQYGLAQAGLDEAAARYGADAGNQESIYNAGALNQFDLAQAGFDAGAGQFNAAAGNQNAQFNAAAEEAALQRALQAAGLTANIGTAQDAGELAGLGMTADLGAMERAIEQAQLGAPLTQLQAAGQLYGALPVGNYTGSEMTGSGTMQGTNITKSNPGLGGLLGAGLTGWATSGFGLPSFGSSLFGNYPTGGAIGM